MMTNLLVRSVMTALFFSVPVLADANELVVGTVNRVVDGDTLHAVVDGKEITVRMAGIDAPESKQPYGAQSLAALSSLTLGKSCTIDIDTIDRYGRKVAFVLCDSNVSVNEVMVGQGKAWVYRRYAKGCRGEFQSLCSAEKESRDAKIGLWEDPAPTPPWIWRKLH